MDNFDFLRSRTILLFLNPEDVEEGDEAPEPVEALLGAVDGEDGCAGVGLGDPTVPLQDDHLGIGLWFKVTKQLTGSVFISNILKVYLRNF